MPHRTPPSFVTLVLLSGLSIATLNLFVPSLPAMADQFGVSYGVMGLSIGGYLAVTAVVQVVLGPLGDIFGRRPVILWGLGIFVVASAGCALTSDIRLFLAFRALQGGIVSGMALSRAMVRDMAGPARAASLLGYMGMAMAVAPMLAPVVGGTLDAVFGWRASFWFFVLCGGSLFILCWYDLGETLRARPGRAMDHFRAYPGLLREPLFLAYAVCLACSIGAFFVFVAGAPLVATALFDLSPPALGAWLGVITFGFFFGNWISGRFSERWTPGQLVLAGRIVALGAPAIALGMLTVMTPTPVTLFGPMILAGFGNGLTSPAANVGVMSVRTDLSGGAAGLSGALTVAVGAVLSSLAAVAVTPDRASWALMALLAVVLTVALAAALYVRRAEIRAAHPAMPAGPAD